MYPILPNNMHSHIEITHFPSCLQYVLAVGSSVFGAMFYGDLAEGESEIHIPDVEPAAFLILLK
jgi:BTB/POZ domain-containing protein 3/6